MKMGSSFIVPFIGAGHETVRILKKKKPGFVWLNDIDYGITAFWKSVYFHPLKFLNKIKRYEPKVSDFYEFKEILDGLTSNPKGIEDVTDIALIKLAIHQISYSGLGAMAGGPIGGQNQTSAYTVGCRWNKNKISKSVWDAYNLLNRSEIRITSWDFEEVLKDKKSEGLVYLDPPYYEQGKNLYSCSFSDYDHWRLSEQLYCRENWVLSYDDNPTIRRFYNFATIHEVDATYTIKTARKKTELIIVN